MSDDLKEQLRSTANGPSTFQSGLEGAALARIEELERERDRAQVHLQCACGFGADDAPCDFHQKKIDAAWNAAIEVAANEIVVNWGHIATPEMRDAIRALKRP